MKYVSTISRFDGKSLNTTSGDITLILTEECQHLDINHTNGHQTIDCIFLASSRVAMSIHWLCYCTVHVYVVILFCDSMWSFWVEANFVLLFVHICIVVGDPITRGGSWDHLTGSTQALLRTFILNTISCGVFVFNYLRWEA
jgi:hypothetical protein